MSAIDALHIGKAGLALTIVALAVNQVGDRLHDLLDPRCAGGPDARPAR